MCCTAMMAIRSLMMVSLQLGRVYKLIKEQIIRTSNLTRHMDRPVVYIQRTLFENWQTDPDIAHGVWCPFPQPEVGPFLCVRLFHLTCPDPHGGFFVYSHGRKRVYERKKRVNFRRFEATLTHLPLNLASDWAAVAILRKNELLTITIYRLEY